VTTLVLQYVLANAAVARSFSAYFAALIGKDPSFFTFPYKDYTVDLMAAGIMILCCLLLSFSTAGGSWFNIIVTGSQLLVILIILIAGFIKANPANMTPFLPYGVKGTQATGYHQDCRSGGWGLCMPFGPGSQV
jgi:APA family basic amino acid/polyamine antiporter